LLTLIHWIAIYSVYRVNQSSNNWGLATGYTMERGGGEEGDGGGGEGRKGWASCGRPGKSRWEKEGFDR